MLMPVSWPSYLPPLCSIDDKDDAVRSTLVLENGDKRWPAPAPPAPAAPAAPPAPVLSKAELEALERQKALDLQEKEKNEAVKSNVGVAAAASGLLALGAVSPSAAFSSMIAKFGLASICGYQAVWGVTPALHSPLMSVTNAVSGLTAIGGMVLAGGGLLPQTGAQWLAALAMTASAINIGGGFTITQRMLDMFRRPTDPPEYTHYYAIPGAVLVGCVAASTLLPDSAYSAEGFVSATYLAASVACLSAIGCLSNQKSARTGNALGLIGVSSGVAAAMASLDVPPPVYVQIVGCLGAGAFAGQSLAKRINITELPQMVSVLLFV